MSCFCIALSAVLLYTFNLNAEEMSSIGKIFEGDHELIKLNMDSNTDESSPYVVIDMKSETCATFMWKDSSGGLRISKVPYHKIIFNYLNINTPYVKFRWYSSDTRKVLDEYIVYVVITIKPEQILFLRK